MNSPTDVYTPNEIDLESATRLFNGFSEILGIERTAPEVADTLGEYEVHRCTLCLGLKPRADFHRDSSRRTGLSNTCRSCSAARGDQLTQLKENHQAHRERVAQGKEGFIREERTSTRRAPIEPQGELAEFDLPFASNVVNGMMEILGVDRVVPSVGDVFTAWEVKRCHSCRQIKHPESFPANRSKADGLHSQCRDCNADQGASYYERNGDQIRGRYRDWYQDHAESERERLLQNYYRPDGLYRLRLQLHQGYHRAVEAGNTAETIAPEELISHWEKNGINPLECYLTGEELTPQNRSIDHYVAISNGGSHTLDNLVPCTWEINQKKRNLSPEDFQEEENITND